MAEIKNERQPEASVDPMFPDRWSPRAFSDKPVSEDDLKSILEAARWSPSCYGEQPWRFIYATTEEDRERFVDTLVEANKEWAADAPVLMFIAAKTSFTFNSRENWWARFDCGAAWMAMALQARKLGLYTHAMAGFDKDKAAELINLPKGYDMCTVVAIGYMGDPDDLPDHYKLMEQPNQRRHLNEISCEGTFSL